MVVVRRVASLLEIAERGRNIGDGRLLESGDHRSDMRVNVPLPTRDLATGFLEPLVPKSSRELQLIWLIPLRQEMSCGVSRESVEKSVIGR